MDGGVSLALARKGKKNCVYVPILMSQRRPRTWVGSIEKYPGPRVPPIFRWYVPTQGFLHGIDNTRVLRGIIFSSGFPQFISNVYPIYLGEQDPRSLFTSPDRRNSFWPLSDVGGRPGSRAFASRSSLGNPSSSSKCLVSCHD